MASPHLFNSKQCQRLQILRWSINYVYIALTFSYSNMYYFLFLVCCLSCLTARAYIPTLVSFHLKWNGKPLSTSAPFFLAQGKIKMSPQKCLSCSTFFLWGFRLSISAIYFFPSQILSKPSHTSCRYAKIYYNYNGAGLTMSRFISANTVFQWSIFIHFHL